MHFLIFVIYNKMDSGLNEVKVDALHKSRRPPGVSMKMDMDSRPMSNVSSRSSNYIYVNSAFTGSLNSVNSNIRTEPPTR